MKHTKLVELQPEDVLQKGDEAYFNGKPWLTVDGLAGDTLKGLQSRHEEEDVIQAFRLTAVEVPTKDDDVMDGIKVTLSLSGNFLVMRDESDDEEVWIDRERLTDFIGLLVTVNGGDK